MDPKLTYHLHRDHPKACGDIAGPFAVLLLLAFIVLPVAYLITG